MELENTNIETKPWGTVETLHINPLCKVKKLTILPMKRISLHYHLYRNAHWTIVSGIGQAQLNLKKIEVKANDVISVLKNTIHRIGNTSDTDNLIIIEVGTGEKIVDDDVIKIEDDFNKDL